MCRPAHSSPPRGGERPWPGRWRWIDGLWRTQHLKDGAITAKITINFTFQTGRSSVREVLPTLLISPKASGPPGASGFEPTRGTGPQKLPGQKDTRVIKLKDIKCHVGSALEFISAAFSPRANHVRTSSRSMECPEQRQQAAAINGRGISEETR